MSLGDRQIVNSRYSHTLSVCLVSRKPENMDEVKLAETRTAITVAIPENRGFLFYDCYLHVLFIDCLVVSRPTGSVRRRTKSTAGGNCQREKRRNRMYATRVFSKN